jgi:hypothetical protein
MNELPRIGLPSWREDAITRVISMYDAEDVDGEPLVKVKRTATDAERYSELLELLSEVFPEAAGLVRSSKAAPKSKLSIIMARLNEYSLDGREFAAISSTAYDWRDKQDDLEEQLQESVKQAKARTSPKVDDDFVKKVVKDTEPKSPAKASTRQTKASAKPKPRTTTRARSK